MISYDMSHSTEVKKVKTKPADAWLFVLLVINKHDIDDVL